jgi:hypothetical protein
MKLLRCCELSWELDGIPVPGYHEDGLAEKRLKLMELGNQTLTVEGVEILIYDQAINTVGQIVFSVSEIKRHGKLSEEVIRKIFEDSGVRV